MRICSLLYDLSHNISHIEMLNIKYSFLRPGYVENLDTKVSIVFCLSSCSVRYSLISRYNMNITLCSSLTADTPPKCIEEILFSLTISVPWKAAGDRKHKKTCTQKKFKGRVYTTNR